MSPGKVKYEICRPSEYCTPTCQDAFPLTGKAGLEPSRSSRQRPEAALLVLCCWAISVCLTLRETESQSDERGHTRTLIGGRLTSGKNLVP